MVRWDPGSFQGWTVGVYLVNTDLDLVPVLSLGPLSKRHMHTEGSLRLHGACGPLREFKKVCSLGNGCLPAAEIASGGAWTEAGCLLPREPLEVCELAGQPAAERASGGVQVWRCRDSE